jgi:hypothetical protein
MATNAPRLGALAEANAHPILVGVGKPWVLDTGTKGTGAEMVPLEKVLEEPGPTRPPIIVPTERRTPAKAPEPRVPWRFKVVDVMTRQVLAEDAHAASTLDLLSGIRSMVDVSVYVWDPKRAAWRPLTLGERQTLWSWRDRQA